MLTRHCHFEVSKGGRTRYLILVGSFEPVFGCPPASHLFVLLCSTSKWLEPELVSLGPTSSPSLPGRNSEGGGLNAAQEEEGSLGSSQAGTGGHGGSERPSGLTRLGRSSAGARTGRWRRRQQLGGAQAVQG